MLLKRSTIVLAIALMFFTNENKANSLRKFSVFGSKNPVQNRLDIIRKEYKDYNQLLEIKKQTEQKRLKDQEEVERQKIIHKYLLSRIPEKTLRDFYNRIY